MVDLNVLKQGMYNHLLFDDSEKLLMHFQSIWLFYTFFFGRRMIFFIRPLKGNDYNNNMIIPCYILSKLILFVIFNTSILKQQSLLLFFWTRFVILVVWGFLTNWQERERLRQRGKTSQASETLDAVHFILDVSELR